MECDALEAKLKLMAEDCTTRLDRMIRALAALESESHGYKQLRKTVYHCLVCMLIMIYLVALMVGLIGIRDLAGDRISAFMFLLFAIYFAGFTIYFLRKAKLVLSGDMLTQEQAM